MNVNHDIFFWDTDNFQEKEKNVRVKWGEWHMKMNYEL